MQYHVNCFDEEVRTSQCSLGELHQSIVPPSWIVKLPPILVRREGEGVLEGGAADMFALRCLGRIPRWLCYVTLYGLH